MRLQTISGVFLLLFISTAFCQADPVTDAIRKRAEENARAVEKNDFETIVKYTYPKAVELVGDKDKMISAMKEATEAMQARGFKISSVTVDTPSPPVVFGNKSYSIVPTLIVAMTPDEKITQKSFLLAISTDKGANWYFLDGSGIDSDSILNIIPDFPESYKLPLQEPAKEEPLPASKPATP